MNQYEVTRQFESELCRYTGAPFAVAVNSGTAALELSLKRFPPQTITIPSKTYCSVPMAVLRAGHRVDFKDYYWRGAYQLNPVPVWDAARRFTSGMYQKGQFMCVSFSTAKILGIEQGGAILHDDPYSDRWFRKMRFDGRTEGVNPLEDTFDVVGDHCIMLPSIAVQLLAKIQYLPKKNEDLPDYEYPDLSRHPAFA